MGPPRGPEVVGETSGRAESGRGGHLAGPEVVGGPREWEKLVGGLFSRARSGRTSSSIAGSVRGALRQGRKRLGGTPAGPEVVRRPAGRAVFGW